MNKGPMTQREPKGPGAEVQTQFRSRETRGQGYPRSKGTGVTGFGGTEARESCELRNPNGLPQATGLQTR